MVEPLPNDLSVVIGDALQCLRNSLDNLAFALGKAENPTMSEKDERSISFPLFDSPNEGTDLRITQMNSVVQGVVRSLVPDPARLGLVDDPLWLLNKAAIYDKHREVTTMAVMVPNVTTITRTWTDASPDDARYVPFGRRAYNAPLGPPGTPAVVFFESGPPFALEAVDRCRSRNRV